MARNEGAYPGSLPQPEEQDEGPYPGSLPTGDSGAFDRVIDYATGEIGALDSEPDVSPPSYDLDEPEFAPPSYAMDEDESTAPPERGPNGHEVGWVEPSQDNDEVLVAGVNNADEPIGARIKRENDAAKLKRDSYNPLEAVGNFLGDVGESITDFLTPDAPTDVDSPATVTGDPAREAAALEDRANRSRAPLGVGGANVDTRGGRLEESVTEAEGPQVSVTDRLGQSIKDTAFNKLDDANDTLVDAFGSAPVKAAGAFAKSAAEYAAETAPVKAAGAALGPIAGPVLEAAGKPLNALTTATKAYIDSDGKADVGKALQDGWNREPGSESTSWYDVMGSLHESSVRDVQARVDAARPGSAAHKYWSERLAKADEEREAMKGPAARAVGFTADMIFDPVNPIIAVGTAGVGLAAAAAVKGSATAAKVAAKAPLVPSTLRNIARDNLVERAGAAGNWDEVADLLSLEKMDGPIVAAMANSKNPVVRAVGQAFSVANPENQLIIHAQTFDEAATLLKEASGGDIKKAAALASKPDELVGVSVAQKSAVMQINSEINTLAKKQETEVALIEKQMTNLASKGDEALKTNVAEAIAEKRYTDAADHLSSHTYAKNAPANKTAALALAQKVESFASEADPFQQAVRNALRKEATAAKLDKADRLDRFARHVHSAYKQGFLTGNPAYQITNLMDNLGKLHLEGASKYIFSPMGDTRDMWGISRNVHNLVMGNTQASQARGRPVADLVNKPRTYLGIENPSGWEFVPGLGHAVRFYNDKLLGAGEGLFRNAAFDKTATEVLERSSKTWASSVGKKIDTAVAGGLINARTGAILKERYAGLANGAPFSPQDVANEYHKLSRPTVTIPDGPAQTIFKDIKDQVDAMDLRDPANAAKAKALIDDYVKKVEESSFLKEGQVEIKKQTSAFNEELNDARRLLESAVFSADTPASIAAYLKYLAGVYKHLDALEGVKQTQVKAAWKLGQDAVDAVVEQSQTARVAFLEESLEGLARVRARKLPGRGTQPVSNTASTVITSLKNQLAGSLGDSYTIVSKEVADLQKARTNMLAKEKDPKKRAIQYKKYSDAITAKWSTHDAARMGALKSQIERITDAAKGKYDEEVRNMLRQPKVAPKVDPRVQAAQAQSQTVVDQYATKRSAEIKAARDDVVSRLTQVRDSIDNAAQGTNTLNLTGPQLSAVDKLGREFANDWANTVAYAQAKGVRETNRIFFDYSTGRTPIDRVINGLVPFSLWQTRNPGYWLDMAVRKPQLLVAGGKYLDATESTRQERGLPVSYAGYFSGSGGEPGDNESEKFMTAMPFVSALDQGYSLLQAYDQFMRAQKTGDDAKVNAAKLALIGAALGGFSTFPYVHDTLTTLGFLGDTPVGNFLPNVPFYKILEASGIDPVRYVGLMVNRELSANAGLTQFQYQNIKKEAPYNNNVWYGRNIMAELSGAVLRGELTLADGYKAVQEKDGNPAWDMARHKADQKREGAAKINAVLPPRTHKDLTPEQARVYELRKENQETITAQGARSKEETRLQQEEGMSLPAQPKFDRSDAGQLTRDATTLQFMTGGPKGEFESTLREQSLKYSQAENKALFRADPANAVYADYYKWQQTTNLWQTNYGENGFPRSSFDVYLESPDGQAAMAKKDAAAKVEEKTQGKTTSTKATAKPISGKDETGTSENTALTDQQVNVVQRDAVAKTMDIWYNNANAGYQKNAAALREVSEAVGDKGPKAYFDEITKRDNALKAQGKAPIYQAAYDSQKAYRDNIIKGTASNWKNATPIERLTAYFADFKKDDVYAKDENDDTTTEKFIHWLSNYTPDTNGDGLRDGIVVLNEVGQLGRVDGRYYSNEQLGSLNTRRNVSTPSGYPGQLPEPTAQGAVPTGQKAPSGAAASTSAATKPPTSEGTKPPSGGNTPAPRAGTGTGARTTGGAAGGTTASGGTRTTLVGAEGQEIVVNRGPQPGQTATHKETKEEYIYTGTTTGWAPSNSREGAEFKANQSAKAAVPEGWRYGGSDKDGNIILRSNVQGVGDVTVKPNNYPPAAPSNSRYLGLHKDSNTGEEWHVFLPFDGGGSIYLKGAAAPKIFPDVSSADRTALNTANNTSRTPTRSTGGGGGGSPRPAPVVPVLPDPSLTPPVNPKQPIAANMEQEKAKATALLPSIPARILSNQQEMRRIWMRSGSMLDFGTWFAMMQSLINPNSYQGLASTLLG